MRRVVLTDLGGTEIGTEELLLAHQGGGQLHRAFSVAVLNSRGQLLLQRRSDGKRTFRRLWSNTCCSHPRPGEDLTGAAESRLGVEMGFTTPLREVASFTYKAPDPESGLTEYEYDHVMVGRFDGSPEPDPGEVAEWRWVEPGELRTDLVSRRELYTPWLSAVVEALLP
jgi:isopentenyl-diphosphate delta-isomerase